MKVDTHPHFSAGTGDTYDAWRSANRSYNRLAARRQLAIGAMALAMAGAFVLIGSALLGAL